MTLRLAMVRLVAALVLPAVAFAGTHSVYAADEKADAKPAAKERAQPRGRVPNYYGDIVSPEQREQIYAIQKKYEADIAPLNAKLKELQAARDKEVEAVLTAEQLAKVNKAKADAAAKRAAAAAKPDAPKTDGDKPAAPKIEKPAAEK